MEAWKFMNRLIRYLEFFIITFVVSMYLTACYETFTASNVLLPMYLLTTSFYYYLSCLKKPPGRLLDFNNTSIKGICKRCNRIVGAKTVHCEVCNKCYHGRDHHCPIIGKCVASNNFRDLYFALLFMMLYSFVAMFRETRFYRVLFVYKYIFFLLSLFVCWMTLLIVTDRTTKELVKNKEPIKGNIKISRLGKLFDKGLVRIIAPYIRWKASIVH